MLYPLSYGGVSTYIPLRDRYTNPATHGRPNCDRGSGRSRSMLAFLILAAALAESDFVATSTADDRPAGRFRKLNSDGSAELDTSQGKQVVRDLISLRRAGVPLPPLPRGPVLITTTGDRVPGRLVGGDGQTLQFLPTWEDDADKSWTVPISTAAVVWFTRPPADTPPDPARDPWLADKSKRDQLRLRNGDVLRGTIDGFGAKPPGVRFVPEGGNLRTVAASELAAVAFNPALARNRKPKGPYMHLVLRDGTRLDVTDCTADGDALKGKTLFGQAVELPVAEVVGLDVYQGKAVYLSDLKPKKSETTAFLGTTWPPVSDRGVRGLPLRLSTPKGEGTFDRGLGTHPRTTLVYDLAGKYGRFEALVGLDAESGTRGQASVRVLVDGKEQPMVALRKLVAGLAVPVRVDVRGAKELTLVIDFGDAGDVGADVNWADARLVG